MNITFNQVDPNSRASQTFIELMAQRGIHVIDRVVLEEIGGGVDLQKGVWCIPVQGIDVKPAPFTTQIEADQR